MLMTLLRYDEVMMVVALVLKARQSLKELWLRCGGEPGKEGATEDHQDCCV